MQGFLKRDLLLLAPFLLGATGLILWQAQQLGYLGASAQPAAAITTVTSWGTSAEPPAIPASTTPSGFLYIQIIDSCDWAYKGACATLRSGPGTDYSPVTRLRNNMVLKVASTTATEGSVWYQVGFDGEVHYPERVTGDWWVAAENAHPFYDPGVQTAAKMSTTTNKRIIVDIGSEILYAYEGGEVFMEQPISAGLELTPTPPGTFFIYRKMPDSYMQGPVPGVSEQYYDLPGVPWDLYFTKDGGAIHGAYWHNSFGRPWSHGCVNLPPAAAALLYAWADVGTPVTVRK